jgi:hypothetical protein
MQHFSGMLARTYVPAFLPAETVLPEPSKISIPP